MPKYPHRGRPPGRRDGCRPPEGRALVPKTSKHAAVLAAAPNALTALDTLRAAGSPQDVIDAVQLSVDYAQERARQALAKAERDAGLDTVRGIAAPKVFRDYVVAEAAKDDTDLTTIAVKSLEDFTAGRWTPPAPTRFGRGQKPESRNFNVRVSQELWDAANAHGSNSEAVAARGGYKLSAAQVVIAAFVATFGTSQDTPAA